MQHRGLQRRKSPVLLTEALHLLLGGILGDRYALANPGVTKDGADGRPLGWVLSNHAEENGGTGPHPTHIRGSYQQPLLNLEVQLGCCKGSHDAQCKDIDGKAVVAGALFGRAVEWGAGGRVVGTTRVVAVNLGESKVGHLQK